VDIIWIGERSGSKGEWCSFDGVLYARYPKAKGRTEREYFAGYKKGRRVRLHVAVWEYYNGPMPSGRHIHHKDGNGANNTIENLECVTPKEHLGGGRHANQGAAGRRNIIKAIAAAPVWHRSEAGKAWHSKHGKEVAANRAWVDTVCIECGSVYKSLGRKTDKYCSVSCKERNLWGRSEYRVEVVCPDCKQTRTIRKARLYGKKGERPLWCAKCAHKHAVYTKPAGRPKRKSV
jgi:hypothetical protein